jgi:predicted dehydrogenase
MLRLAFAGAGDVVRDRHLPALARIASVKVVSVADEDVMRAEALAAEAGARAFSSVEALLEAGGADALAVCVPPRAHAEVALAAARAGLRLFVEKPLAASVEDAQTIADAASGVTGFNLRCHRHVLRAREVLAAGALGEVVALRTEFTDPLNPVAPWRRRREHGGGALWDKAVHHVDLWRFLLDDEIDELAAATRSDGDRDDTVALLTGRTRGGVLLETLAADHGPVRQVVEIVGADATLELDLYRSDGFYLIPPGELPGAVGTRLRAAARVVGALPQLARDARAGGVFRETYSELWRRFAAGGSGLATLDDGLRAVELVENALESVAAVA